MTSYSRLLLRGYKMLFSANCYLGLSSGSRALYERGLENFLIRIIFLAFSNHNDISKSELSFLDRGASCLSGLSLLLIAD